MKKRIQIKAIDLFCGVGGLTCGLQKAGIPVVAGIDLDPDCEYAYTHNNMGHFIKKSVDDVTGAEIQQLYGDVQVKVLVGCAPCQPFSRHQKDKHHRSKHKDWRLLYQFGRIVKECNPDIVSMENVPELAREKVFIDFMETLKNEGYQVTYTVVNAADYGVPQRRRRLLLLAARGGNIRLLPPTHSHPVTVIEAIGTLPPVKAGEVCVTDTLHRSANLSDINLNRIKHSRPGGTWRDWPESLRLPCHRKQKGATYSSVYGRMRWDAPAPTITTQFTIFGTGRFGHPTQDRALTLREGAILQSFPSTYDFINPNNTMSFSKIARQIGNAVPPRLGEIIGESILNFLNNVQ